MYVCMSICIYAYVHVYEYANVVAYTCTCKQICTGIYVLCVCVLYVCSALCSLDGVLCGYAMCIACLLHGVVYIHVLCRLHYTFAYVCMCVHVCMCMYDICMYVCTYACMFVRLRACVETHFSSHLGFGSRHGDFAQRRSHFESSDFYYQADLSALYFGVVSVAPVLLVVSQYACVCIYLYKYMYA